MASNPAVNTMEPAHLLAVEKNKESSNGDLYWGIFWGILCLFGAIGFVGDLRKKAPQDGGEVQVA